LRSAVYLTGKTKAPKPVQQEVKEKGVVKGGRSMWDAEELASWVSTQQFGGEGGGGGDAERADAGERQTVGWWWHC
jgi:hypothetical protein